MIEVNLTGRPDDTATLIARAELDGVRSVETDQSLTQTKERFRVQLPSEFTGRLRLLLSAQNAGGCELAAGEGLVDLDGDGSYSLDIALGPRQGCMLEVELVGPAVGRVISNPEGIDCGTQCKHAHARNVSVELTPMTTELFGGWFADASVSGCAGRVNCTITIGSGVTRVRANFIERASCTSNGWCLEADRPAENRSNLYALWGSGRDDVWAVGDFGTILHGDGIRWSAVPMVTSRALRGVWGSEATDVWAVGEAGTALHYDGADWTAVPVPTYAWLNGIWGRRRDDVWVVGDSGTILHWNGSTWSTVASGTTQSLRSVWGSGPQDVWAVGDGGVLLRYGGVAWAPLGAPMTSGALYGVWGTDSNNIWMVGEAGVILHWTGSLPLSQIQMPGIAGLHAVWGTNPTQTWAVGDDGVILLWNGLQWTAVPGLSSSVFLTSLWGSGAQDVWALGKGLEIWRYRR